MATSEQIRANGANARRSTGPRTPQGKAKSSQNALKHGLRAQITVLPDENIGCIAWATGCLLRRARLV